MKKSSSTKEELRAIISICDSKKDIQERLSSMLTLDHFNLENTNALYKRILKLRTMGKDIPTRSILAQYDGFNDQQRTLLKTDSVKPLKQMVNAEAVIDLLEEKRRNRAFTDMLVNAGERFRDEDNPQELDDVMAKLRAEMQYVEPIFNADILSIGIKGQVDTLTPVVKEIVMSKTARLIPTGFIEFDKRNGGFFRKSLVTLASNTGGGKSVMGLNLALNMFHAGYNVILLSLEMGEEEKMARLLSNISQVDFNRILLRRMTPKNKKQAKAAWRKFVAFGHQNNCRLDYWNPAGLTASTIAARLANHHYDVVVVDMINLLEPEALDKGANDAARLGASSRALKLFAVKSDAVVIQLAQMDDEGRIKYARKLGEDSDNVWIWICDEEAKSAHAFMIEQWKGRNQENFSFPLIENFARMRLENPIGVVADARPTPTASKRKKKRSHHYGEKDGEKTDKPTQNKVDSASVDGTITVDDSDA